MLDSLQYILIRQMLSIGESNQAIRGTEWYKYTDRMCCSDREREKDAGRQSEIAKEI